MRFGALQLLAHAVEFFAQLEETLEDRVMRPSELFGDMTCLFLNEVCGLLENDWAQIENQLVVGLLYCNELLAHHVFNQVVQHLIVFNGQVLQL